MAALVSAMRSGRIQADPAIVIANVPGAPALELARSWGIPVEVIEHKKFAGRPAHEAAVVEVLRRQGVDLVCLAGYMRLLSPFLVAEFRNRIINIHPALLPAFPGLNAQAQALEAGVKITGCTVHFVDEQCDHGPIILQSAVPVLEDDTVESLSARILDEEHRTYAEAVALFFEGRLAVDGGVVRIAPPPMVGPRT